MKGIKGLGILTMLVALADLITGGIFCWKVYTMQAIPVLYVGIIAVVVVIFSVLVFISARVKVMRVCMAVLGILALLIMVLAFLIVSKLDNTMNKISTDTNDEVVEISVIAKADSSMSVISDLVGKKVGYVENDVYAAKEQAYIQNHCSNVIFVAYPDEASLALALLNGEIDAAVMNTSTISILSELDDADLSGFSDKIKVLGRFELEAIEITVPETTEAETTAASSSSASSVLTSNDHTFFVYFSGIDTTGSVNTRSRSDVNIIAAVNTQTGKVQLINTPRDYYVSHPASGGVADKLTHAGLWGVENSVGALESLYNIKIDYYVKMNFTGFVQIIDAVGGIDVYSDTAFDLGDSIHIQVGYTHLNGTQALWFARERHAFAEGDIARGKHQMAVITAMIQKMTTTDALTHFSELLDSISDCILTNMPTSTMYSLVAQQIANGTSWNIDTYTVTGEGAYRTTYSMPSFMGAVWIPDYSTVEIAKSLMEAVIK